MKLNKSIRTAIVESALKKAGIPEKKTAIRQRYAAWAEAVRVRYVTPEQLQLIHTAIAASKQVSDTIKERNFRPYTSCGIRKANIAGQTRDVFYDGSLIYPSGNVSETDRISPEYGQVVLKADDALTVLLYSIDRDSKALTDEIDQLTASLWAVLNSAQTDKRLIEIWPESVAFIPAAEKANAPQLPALPIDCLNKLIGLP